MCIFNIHKTQSRAAFMGGGGGGGGGGAFAPLLIHHHPCPAPLEILGYYYISCIVLLNILVRKLPIAPMVTNSSVCIIRLRGEGFSVI